MIPSPSVVEAFQRDGAVVLRGLLSAEDLALLETGVEANLASPSARALVASPTDDPGLFFEDFRNWGRNPAYERLARSATIGAAVSCLMGSKTARLHHDHLLVKTAGTRQATPWHQDQPYYNLDGAQTCSLWAPLDPVPAAASLRFVAGSHRGPWLMPRTFMTAETRWFPAGALAELPDVDADPSAYRILNWALEPGDVLAFSMLTLHAAGGAPGRRRALSIRYIGDDVTHAPRSWRTSPDFPELDGVLPAGVALDHPLFPLVWPPS